MIEGKWNDPTPLPFSDPDTWYGCPAFSQDGKTLYFSSNKRGGKGGLDLFKASLDANGQWGKVTNLGESINTAGDEMFPFMAEDQRMYFASDGHPGLGGLDIFVANKDKDGNVAVKNLGVPVNSRWDDFGIVFKTLTDGYLSSNREGGKGDDDIYYFEILKPFRFTKTIKGKISDDKGNILAGNEILLLNVDASLSASAIAAEDGTFTFTIDTEDSIFYVQAVREKYETGKSEIINLATTDADEISTSLQLNKIPVFNLVIRVKNNRDNEPLSGVKLKIVDKNNQKTDLQETQWAGEFSKILEGFKMNQKISFEITLEKEGYQPKTISAEKILTAEGNQIFELKIEPVKVEKFETGIDIAKVINLKPIYFESASAKVNIESALILDQIVKVLNENPNMVIEINAHTDCRGPYNSNMALSDSRAKSCATYISSRITNPTRISGKGFGETKLINNCSCEGDQDSGCSDEEHSQNRRTEFIIIKM